MLTVWLQQNVTFNYQRKYKIQISSINIQTIAKVDAKAPNKTIKMNKGPNLN